MEKVKLQKNIIGKWHKKRYLLLKELGRGGTGNIFLARGDNLRHYAIKLSKDNISLNREFKYLRELADIAAIVRVYEMDDLEDAGESLHFLVLEYIDGASLRHYMDRRLTTEEIVSLMLVIFKLLADIHSSGYILGDLKPENIMVDEVKKAIRLVDLGGVVKIGETIREYTPAYDRACWKMGDRKAEKTYDYFSGLMLMIQLLLRRRMDPTKENAASLKASVASSSLYPSVKDFILKGLNFGGEENNYIKELKDLYKIVKNYKKYEIIKGRDKALNALLAASIMIFIATTIMLMI